MEEGAQARPEGERARADERETDATEASEGEDRQSGIAAALAEQWAELRAARRALAEERERVVPAAQAGGTTNFSRAEVPWGIDLAAAWSWRLLVVGAALVAVLYLLAFFAVVVVPVVVALLAAALLGPLVRRITALGLPRRISALITVILALVVVALLFSFVGSQIANGTRDLSAQLADGVEQVRDWLRTGPLKVSDADIGNALSSLQERLSASDTNLLGYAAELGATVGHVVAGIFIVLFSTYFFLADGALIWTWVVRLFPRAARERTDSSGRVAWRSLTQFVRATVVVAAVDATGIVIAALILNVPFVAAIGVLVFLGAFVPLIGATISGTVAVLLALVAHGPVIALIMLAAVIAVQQVEAHVLQPFVMGRLVSVHPLGVIVAIACGVLLAGVAGALFAVPLAAALNAVAQHLASWTEPGQDAAEAAADDPGPPPPPEDEEE